MPINAHPDYIIAEREYLQATTPEEKIEKLKKMISVAPKHKSSENLLANLKTRLRKLQEQLEKSKQTKKGAGARYIIKKEDIQAVIIGFTNSGKSTLLQAITNANPKVSEIPFANREPVVGIMDYHGTPIQIIEIPAFESEYYDRGIVNTADSIIILITSLSQIDDIFRDLDKAAGKRIIVYNKIDKLSETEKRKLSETLKSKKLNFVLISAKTGEGILELKESIFNSIEKIRVYTKEPGKTLEEKATKPIILRPNATVKDAAEKIFKGFSSRVVQTKIWGPSSKFAGQIVSLRHELKDRDVVEFKTK